MQFDQLKQCDFITLLGGAAMTWPLAAQQSAQLLPTPQASHRRDDDTGPTLNRKAASVAVVSKLS
jgi:hypothetical protein